VLTLDLAQHFYDFTLVLLPLLVLFGPPRLLTTLDQGLPRLRLGQGWPWIGLGAAVVAGYHLPLPTTIRWMAVYGARAAWVALLAVIVVGLIRAWPTPTGGAADPQSADAQPPGTPSLRVTQAIRPVGSVAWVVVVLMAVNGLAPYLELKTATTFTMYSNLVTVDGETNHWLVPRTAALRTQDPIVITGADDDDLGAYVDSGFAVPAVNLADHLAHHPEAATGLTTVGRPVEAVAMPWWQHRFLFLRATPATDPPVCQNAFLPLG
jgi:hypothetical protein